MLETTKRSELKPQGRRCQRHRVPGISGTLGSPGDVHVLDLSLFGMAFESPRPLRVGERCFLELRHDRHAVSVEVAIRWCATPAERSAGQRPAFRIGACFVDILRDEMDSGIWRWIDVDPESAA